MSNITYAYSRFCTKRFPLPSEAQVADLERRIKVIFPDDYRQYLLEFNGGYFDDPLIVSNVEGCPAECLGLMCGLRPTHREAGLGREDRTSLFDDNDPPITLPIGSTPLGGLIILITELGIEERGSILLKQAWGEFHYLADGIEEFFDLLHSPESTGSV